MEKLFEQFIRESRYLRNIAPKTIEYYSYCFLAYKKYCSEISKSELKEFVMKLREAEIKPGAINSYIRGLNVFLNWLYQNEHTSVRFKIDSLKAEAPVHKSLTEDELKRIITYKAKDTTYKRLQTMLMLIMDTGLRIDEVINLERSKIDFDNFLLSVKGKGNKERVVPFSYELRKVLYKYSKDQKFELLFCTRNGSKLNYHNIRRDFGRLMKRLGIEADSSFHLFRRTFATSFIRNGGNPMVLQRILGHSSAQMTQLYVKLVTEDLSKEQHKVSILNKLR